MSYLGSFSKHSSLIRFTQQPATQQLLANNHLSQLRIRICEVDVFETSIFVSGGLVARSQVVPVAKSLHTSAEAVVHFIFYILRPGCVQPYSLSDP